MWCHTFDAGTLGGLGDQRSDGKIALQLHVDGGLIIQRNILQALRKQVAFYITARLLQSFVYYITRGKGVSSGILLMPNPVVSYSLFTERHHLSQKTVLRQCWRQY